MLFWTFLYQLKNRALQLLYCFRCSTLAQWKKGVFTFLSSISGLHFHFHLYNYVCFCVFIKSILILKVNLTSKLKKIWPIIATNWNWNKKMKMVNGFKYKPNSHGLLGIFPLDLRLTDTECSVLQNILPWSSRQLQVQS